MKSKEYVCYLANLTPIISALLANKKRYPKEFLNKNYDIFLKSVAEATEELNHSLNRTTIDETDDITSTDVIKRVDKNYNPDADSTDDDFDNSRL
jgi:hypothetical protein